MEENTINVKVNITDKDIYSSQKSILAKRFSPVSLVVICIFFAIFIVGSIFDKVAEGSKPIGAIILILVLAIFILLLPMQLKKYSKNTLKTSRILQKTQRYQIDNEGIGVTSESGQSYIKWEEFYKAVETKENFLFFISKEQAYIVPKRCFGENIEQFELLRNYMKNAPIPKDEKKSLFFGRSFGVGCLVVYILLFLVNAVAFLILGNLLE